MERVTDIRQGVEKLLTIRGREIPEFSLEQPGEDGFTPILLWEGKRIPLFTTRYDPRIRHIAAYGNKTEENSALNVYAFTGRDVSLTAGQMITLYGGTIHPEKPPFPANYTARALEPLWSVVRSGPKDWNDWMRKLAELESRAGFAMEINLEAKKLYESIPKYAEKKEALEMIREKLSNAGVIEDQSTPSRICYRYTKPLFRYCTKKAGNTLEVKTLLEARSIRENGRPYFDDCQMSVNIDWDGKINKPWEKEAETRNEVDLILTRGTKSLFISCKNGDIEDEELYKLNTLATKFGGPYARKMLVATNLDRGSDAANRFFHKRAGDMGVILLSEAASLSRAEWEAELKSAME